SVHTAAHLGARHLILTNAAGGIHSNLRPGSLMAVRAHLDWTRSDILRQPAASSADGEPGGLYSPRLLGLLHETAQKRGIQLHQGTYAAMTGPNYETPAEIRALRSCGADAVGMSTTREAEAAMECGLECVAVSCITNRAAGLCEASIHHGEVLTTAAAVGGRLADLLEGLLERLANAG
ncbi:MAG TPA: purine-nucleoside phosphorylase, partial [Gemmataceae bacterium]|nr:purine-nucleoside phosphorylase [Gemmataceae bacterium]